MALSENDLAGTGLAPAGLFTAALFLLLFSGPPKFRVREAEASLYGELDTVLIVQVLIWLVAGAWITRQLWLSYKGKRPALRFMLPQKITMILIALLAVGTATSLSMPLTAFKVYQVTVEFLFCLIFIEWHGVEKFLELLLIGNLLLCTMIGVCAIVVPDFVFAESETGAVRLEGRMIAEAGVVAAFAFMLLLGRRRKTAGFWPWFAVSGVILIASFTRNAWIAVAVFVGLALWRRPKLPHLKVAYALCALLVLAVSLGGMIDLNRVRDPANIYTLSDRVGLWAYLTDAVLTRSPVMGLGYVAGTRTLGPEYNSELGSGHSIFFEMFVGGGLVSLVVFLLLLVLMCWHARKLLSKNADAIRFTTASLFLAVAVMGIVGGELDSTPFAFTFWGLVSALPALTGPVESSWSVLQNRSGYSGPLLSKS